jgi:riboflavin kinase/FMN adenylyltransferase
MKYIKGIEAYQDERPSAITLGKFDGLHLGHELLVSRVEEYQRTEGVAGIVFAFDMRPLFEKLNKPYQMLLTNEEKAKRLDGRVEYFIDCPLEEKISSMEAEDFIEKVLVDRFHAKYIVVGTDFRFGHEKRGDYHMLQKYSEKYGFQVDVIEKKQYEGREISSTYIKELLAEGKKELAEELLGYKYKK